ncbi:hypothetical protein, partial [Stenotrophomonas maltophilia]|uniref:hypothetical protein n=1 Tax=Stenotrophomonas maltophilia TaxID=40324 RepID=UPI0014308EFF
QMDNLADLGYPKDKINVQDLEDMILLAVNNQLNLYSDTKDVFNKLEIIKNEKVIVITEKNRKDEASIKKTKI